MQKIKLVHYRAEIKYTASRITQDINILLAPSDIIHPSIIINLNPLTPPTSHLIAWSEHTDYPEHHISYGDLTPTIIKRSSDTGALLKLSTRLGSLENIPYEDFENLMEEQLDEFSKDNFSIPHYTGMCSNVVKTTGTYDDTPENRLIISKLLKDNDPFFLDNKKQIIKGENIPPEVLKVLEILNPKKKLRDHQPQSTEHPTTPNITKMNEMPPVAPPTPAPDVKEQNKGKLLGMINNKKYKKEDLKALVDGIGIEKLRLVHPEDEVEQLITYLKK